MEPNPLLGRMAIFGQGIPCDLLNTCSTTIQAVCLWTWIRSGSAFSIRMPKMGSILNSDAPRPKEENHHQKDHAGKKNSKAVQAVICLAAATRRLGNVQFTKECAASASLRSPSRGTDSRLRFTCPRWYLSCGGISTKQAHSMSLLPFANSLPGEIKVKVYKPAKEEPTR
jgi:hypothetical protein